MPVVAIVAVSALAVVIVVAVPVAVAAVVTVERNSKKGARNFRWSLVATQQENLAAVLEKLNTEIKCRLALNICFF